MVASRDLPQTLTSSTSTSGRALGSAPAPDPVVVRTAEEIQKCCEEELKAAKRVSFSVDLAFAAKRQLGFLRTIDSLPCLHKGPAVIRAIRRF